MIGLGENQIKEENCKVFDLISHYLLFNPDYITQEDLDEITRNGVSEEHAFQMLLAAACGLDIDTCQHDRELFEHYFTKMVRKLNPLKYMSNPHYKNIKIPAVNIGNCELSYHFFKPYEGFIRDEIVLTKEGRKIPQIGFFDREFRFSVMLEGGRVWMTITPNEIETMKVAVREAAGHVLTFGLGLGYFAYMVTQKAEVKKVTVVEKNSDCIQLFKKYILPQFHHSEKVKIIHDDAFSFAETRLHKGKYDFVFTDLWHDVSDGAELYIKMKNYEEKSPGTRFSYWIEKSIRCYI